MPIRNALLFSLSAALCLTVISPAIAIDKKSNGIEKNPLKEYQLQEKHGPWMIMVGTFSDVQESSMTKRTEGLSARDAANKVVNELRGKGIPAYVYSQDARTEKIDTFDRLGNKDERRFIAQNGMICVLAGNYPKIDDPIAQKTLNFVKRYHPKFLQDSKSGAIFRDSGSKERGPFAGAFLTINPTLKPTEVVRRKVDNETKHFNSGIEYALVNVKHKYTLRVATFSGKSAIPLGSSKYTNNESIFDKTIVESGPYNLARAGEDAMQLTYAMRRSSEATRKSFGADRFEAYVFHDKYQSIVTVGGFDSKDDPEIKRLAQLFMAKYKLEDSGEYAYVTESLSLSDDPNAPPLQTWAFDPVPEIIEIPHL